MLAYAYKYVKLTDNNVTSIDPEKFENIRELMTELLIMGVSRQMKKGLLRDYESRTEEMTAVRGRISMGETVNRRSLTRCRLVCVFDEYVTDTIMNRILKTVMLLLIRSDIKKEQKNRLAPILRVFSDVQCTELRSIKWDRFVYNRHNSGYRLLMTLCRIICENMLPSTEKGDRVMREILPDNLPKLYEKFLLEYFKLHHSGEIYANAS